MFTLPCLSLRWTAQVWCGNKNTPVCSPRGGAGAQGREELASYLPISAAGSVWGSFLHNRLLKHFTCSVLLVRSRRLQADHPPALSRLGIARLLERAVRRASPAAPRSPAAGLLEVNGEKKTHAPARDNYSSWPRLCSAVTCPKTSPELGGREERRLARAARRELRFDEVLRVRSKARLLGAREGDPSGPHHAGVGMVLQSRPHCFRKAVGPGRKPTWYLQTNAARSCWRIGWQIRVWLCPLSLKDFGNDLTLCCLPGRTGPCIYYWTWIILNLV